MKAQKFIIDKQLTIESVQILGKHLYDGATMPHGTNC